MTPFVSHRNVRYHYPLHPTRILKMKSRVLYIFLFCFIVHPFYSQNKIKLHDKKFSHEIASELNEGKYRKGSAAYYNTYIGNYQQAINYYSQTLDWDLDTLSYTVLKIDK